MDNRFPQSRHARSRRRMEIARQLIPRRFDAQIIAAFIITLLSAAVWFSVWRPPHDIMLPPRVWTSYTATAYCLRGYTASGVPVAPGIVASDPTLIPLGTDIVVVFPEHLRVRVPDGTYHVRDTGDNVKGRTIDIYMPSCRAAKAFGTPTVWIARVTP